jgi:hypothetical protein
VWTIEGNHAGDYLGWSLANAGDVNGDGFADVIIGAPGAATTGGWAGRVDVHYGLPNGISSDPAWSAFGQSTDNWFGGSVSTAGDVNDDGFADVLVGAPSSMNGEYSEGRAYVFHGSPVGLSHAPSWTAESDQSGAELGRAVSSAGDFNGDGYDDVLIGAPNWGDSEEGQIFVYFGSSSGLNLAPRWASSIQIPNVRLGSAVAGVGDVNGDGYDDILAGAPYCAASLDGCVFLFYGAAGQPPSSSGWSVTGESSRLGSTLGSGDFNADGYSDLVIATTPRDENGQWSGGVVYVYNGSANGPAQTPSWTGNLSLLNSALPSAVGSAGDFNADGYEDLAFGAQSYSNGQDNEGAVFVFFGSSTGLSATPGWMVESNRSYSYLGASLAVVRAHRSYLLVGEPGYAQPDTKEGAVHLFAGMTYTAYLPLLSH